ncbi:hypothetical protein REC12_10065 [Desulfosporosinus sp. PR]|uniref:hypothetical protein n=1 Tax=Candidatus Desulfosporosinus nitrosoreducens TaxID=3401928 RepID=UPI0027FEBD1D|nr:hypothetical protein [Desulfosporosinus sp. PR]MDQ7093934.1 hypothetical protein [Desulfosporosinus sp. PR]
MSQQNYSCSKKERVHQILKLLQAGQPREKIADQFGYSTWKSLDIYMRRHGFTWDSQRNIYTNAAVENPPGELGNTNIADINAKPTDVSPEEIVRLFSIGILDAKEIAKQTGFSGHKEMASYMRRRGYVWSSSSLNYFNANPPPEKPGSADNSIKAEDIPQKQLAEDSLKHSLAEAVSIDKYLSLLDFLWQSRNKLIKIIESINDETKIQFYHIPGKAKTKSIFLSDSLSDLMMTLCEKHSLSQRQGYEAALVEYLSRYGFREQIDELLNVQK